jgi:hypothetical protein
VRARARPGPVLRPRRDPGAHRIERDIAGGCDQVRASTAP